MHFIGSLKRTTFGCTQKISIHILTPPPGTGQKWLLISALWLGWHLQVVLSWRELEWPQHLPWEWPLPDTWWGGGREDLDLDSLLSFCTIASSQTWTGQLMEVTGVWPTILDRVRVWKSRSILSGNLHSLINRSINILSGLEQCIFTFLTGRHLSSICSSLVSSESLSDSLLHDDFFSLNQVASWLV